MYTGWLSDFLTYDGTALRPHWIYEQTGQLGSAVVAFSGPCDVSLVHLVDLEDVRRKAPIASDSMLHFIAELYGTTLLEGTLLQRLWMSAIQQDLQQQTNTSICLTRRGDDLWTTDDRKLSVAITTASTTSVLLHLGLNIVTNNTPVPTAGLQSDWGLADLHAMGVRWMQALVDEWQAARRSTWKVRAV